MDEDIKLPKISVLLPVYNGAEFLQTAIDSILGQSFSNFEFIIINDASTDNSENVILSNTDSRIVYVKNELNLGLIKTLNKGLDICKGEYIARMDQDDIALPTRFEKQVNILDNHPEIGVCGTCFTFFGYDTQNRVIEHPENPEQIKIAMLGYCAIGHPTVLLRKKAIQNLRYDVNYQAAEDYEFWSRLLRITKFYNIQESLLDYRYHGDNMSIKESGTQSIGSKRTIQNQLSYLGFDENPLFVQYSEAIFQTFVRKLESNEFMSLVLFANELEIVNQKKQFYDVNLLKEIIHERLFALYDKTEKDSFKFYLFLLKHKSELIKNKSITYNLKIVGKIIVGKKSMQLIRKIRYTK
ncbi:glycosyltransferase [Empedobacter falsenii]|uniref:glycosyltransferase family 2 protein n=1 Tax=Empedobacter falsenii TaxID=343874 RepID=UPI0025752497|nr:glycosyltransferase [Empedobacter falsenii]MDM1062264.1 glycosyltransferase [Empedobacter falsenii]